MKKYDAKKAEQKRKETEGQARELISTILNEYHTDPTLLAEAFAFSSNFYQYSAVNTQLIFSQNRGATYCQSFNAWKKMGHSVLSGERGLKIWVPIRTTLLEIEKGEFVKLSEATKEQREAYQNGSIKGYEKLSFGIGNVFDISQTTFPKEDYPKLFSMGYPSDQHLAICRGIEDFAAEQLHCPVLQSDLSSISRRGAYYPNQNIIKINNKLEDTQRLCTTIHELGHALIHSGSSAANKSVSQKEIEADALSIIVQANYGIELTEARKIHFKDHYDSYISTIIGDGNRDYRTAVDDIFNSVFQVYKEHVDMINDYVSKRLADTHIEKDTSINHLSKPYSDKRSKSKNKLIER